MAVGSPSNSAGSDFFEFFFDPRSAAGSCPADDVFLAGKLLPFRSPSTPGQSKTQPNVPKPSLSDFRRSETPTWSLRGKREAQYRRLRRPSPPKTQKCWRLFAFPLQAQGKMEMKDIRSRQRRGAAAEVAAGPWKLLQSLSCKAVEVRSESHVRTV